MDRKADCELATSPPTRIKYSSETLAVCSQYRRQAVTSTFFGFLQERKRRSQSHTLGHLEYCQDSLGRLPLCSSSYMANRPLLDGLMNRPFRIMGGVYDIQ